MAVVCETDIRLPYFHTRQAVKSNCLIMRKVLLHSIYFSLDVDISQQGDYLDVCKERKAALTIHAVKYIVFIRLSKTTLLDLRQTHHLGECNVQLNRTFALNARVH